MQLINLYDKRRLKKSLNVRTKNKNILEKITSPRSPHTGKLALTSFVIKQLQKCYAFKKVIYIKTTEPRNCVFLRIF